MSGNHYKFNPEDHGFEPVENYPELRIDYDAFVKIISYSDYGGLVYWYLIASKVVNHDDADARVHIAGGVYDSRRKDQDLNRLRYSGLIGNDEFATQLITHLLGTLNNQSLVDVAPARYDERLGPKMRAEFPQYYR